MGGELMKKIENKISSREVAEMIDIQHKHLLDKIDRINKDLVAENSSTEKYWIEGTFNYNGRDFREFQITKRGCEFLAHKTTGTKGNLFTDKYMDKFAEMEKQLVNPLVNLDLANQMLNMAQGTQIMGQVVQGLLQTVDGMKSFLQDSIQVKDSQINKALSLVGLRSHNVFELTNKLKEVLKKKYKLSTINASMEVYKKTKRSIFEEFKVDTWEQIPVGKYNSVMAFIEEVI
jgi:phage regulator Rha-like protein